MKIRVIVLIEHGDVTEGAKFDDFVSRSSTKAYVHDGLIYRDYIIDHNDPAQRRVLGEQCRNTFEAGQCVITYPVAS